MEPKTYLLYLSEWLGVIAVVWIAAMSPRMRPRPVDFKYPRREGIVSLSLYLFALVGQFLFYSRLPVSPVPMDALWQRVGVAAVMLVLFLVALLSRGQPLRSAGWGRQMLGPAFRLGLALAFLVIFLRGKVFALINGISMDEGYAFLAWLGIAVAEESVFRGYIQLRLNSWLGSRWGWIATAGLFLVWNVPRWLANPVNLLPVVFITSLQALILSWLMKKSGHVLAPCLYRLFSEWMVFLV